VWTVFLLATGFAWAQAEKSPGKIGLTPYTHLLSWDVHELRGKKLGKKLFSCTIDLHPDGVVEKPVMWCGKGPRLGFSAEAAEWVHSLLLDITHFALDSTAWYKPGGDAAVKPNTNVATSTNPVAVVRD
jgi:hypothetical protein